MIKKDPAIVYALAIQSDLDEALKYIGFELGEMLDTKLSQVQMEMLGKIMRLYQEINSLTALQRANFIAANDEESQLSLVDVDDCFRQLKQHIKTTLAPRHISVNTGALDKIGVTFFPQKIVEQLTHYITQHIYHGNEQDTLTLSMTITNRQKNQCQLVLNLQNANYYSTDYDLQRFFKGECNIFEGADEVQYAKQQFSQQNGVLDYQANQHEGVIFSLTLPCYLFAEAADKYLFFEKNEGAQTAEPNTKLATDAANTAANTFSHDIPEIKVNPSLAELNYTRILIVDDSRVSREALKSVIQSNPRFKIVETNTGREAIDLMLKSDFDIVLTDIYMNDMNGMEFTRQIRFVPRYQDVPVIGLTAATDEDLINEFKRHGGTDLITKPVDEKKIMPLINQYALSYALYDKAKADLHSNANEALQSKLMRLFFKEIEDLLSAIEDGASMEALAEMAHKLVASAEYCGYMLAHRRAKLFERYVLQKAKTKITIQALNDLKIALQLSQKHLLNNFH
ncbi:response regulator [Ostreibacterium oceani]|uniref:Response regulator n=1 Tax=Ostreibacterium oceani TaxID=2654998 RepID=A0A6N7EZF0_9GAMM|nr:response regulator [Ostreibacterium oceani]MPV85878.1 response regulator [Ostreibacterium oceani]